jgi:hypothetical protein
MNAARWVLECTCRGRSKRQPTSTNAILHALLAPAAASMQRGPSTLLGQHHLLHLAMVCTKLRSPPPSVDTLPYLHASQVKGPGGWRPTRLPKGGAPKARSPPLARPPRPLGCMHMPHAATLWGLPKVQTWQAHSLGLGPPDVAAAGGTGGWWGPLRTPMPRARLVGGSGRSTGLLGGGGLSPVRSKIGGWGWFWGWGGGEVGSGEGVRRLGPLPQPPAKAEALEDEAGREPGQRDSWSTAFTAGICKSSDRGWDIGGETTCLCQPLPFSRVDVRQEVKGDATE